MKKIHLLLVFLLALTTFSCSKYYREFQQNENMIWDKNDVKSFEVEIKDETKLYDLIIWIRHHAETQLGEIPLRIKVSNVTTGKVVFEADIDQKIRNTDNSLVGEAMGDYCDIENNVKPAFKFDEKGKYKFEIKLDSSDPKISSIIHVGLILDQKK